MTLDLANNWHIGFVSFTMSEQRSEQNAFLSSDAFRLRMEQTVRRYAMFAPGQTVVVAVSGGPDSTALLHALWILHKEWQLSLVVAHLDHGFRGEESEAEAAYVRELCVHLGISCRDEYVDVPAVQRERHLTAQEAAREVRHAFLTRVAAETGAERIALGHTRDDRAETVLLNIFRGTGMDGLAGFPATAFPLVRPLYDTTRQQVEEYCAEQALAPRRDSSNAKTRYRRNRTRLELLPQLRAHFNPHVEDALLRLADLARDDNAALEAMAVEALDRVSMATEQGAAVRLSRWQLDELPVALRRRVLRLAILRLRGTLQDVHFQTIENLLSFGVGEGSESRSASYGVDLPACGGQTLRIRTDRETVELSMASWVTGELEGWQIPLTIPGRTVLESPDKTLVIEAYQCPLSALRKVLESLKPGRFAVWRGADLALPLTVRSWRHGDRMRPRGLGGTKKLQDLFTDRHIPTGGRTAVPLLVESAGEGRILAVGDWRYDEIVLFVGTIIDTNIDFDTDFERILNDHRAQEELLVLLWVYQ